jgi:AbrB family looped-hinge helix DNA binding protein
VSYRFDRDLAKTVQTDRSGRIIIPKEIRDDIGIEEGDLIRIEKRNDEILLKPLHLKKNPVEAVVEMTLPVSTWEIMEGEIEKGAVEE